MEFSKKILYLDIFWLKFEKKTIAIFDMRTFMQK